MDIDTVNFIVNVVLTAVGLIAVWLVVLAMAVRSINRKMQLVQEQQAREQMVPLTVEIAGDQYLCYNTRTMDFVCQGSNLEEIRQRFKQRYPEKNAAIVAGDDQAVSVLQQQLKTNRL